MRDLIEIINYATSAGRRPFEEWFKGLDQTVQGVVLARLNRIRMGNFGDCEPVDGSKVFELRIHYGPGYRLYFGKQGDRFVILFCGGSKRAQSRDIQKASRYWQDYQSRASEG